MKHLLMEHLPAWLIVLPLLSAGICLLLRQKTVVRVYAILVSWACLAMAAILLTQVLASGAISYHMGGWVPPLGIEYRVDLLNAYVLLIVASRNA